MTAMGAADLSMPENTSPGLDPVLMAVLANRLDAIVREMTNTLFRTGRSALLNTAKDFSCSIVTADHELLSSADGLQVHVLGSGMQTRSMTELHPELAAGDAFLHNDPYLGNTHTADHTILVPVFVDGEHMFTAAAKAHQADCGNAKPATMDAFCRDLYEEGGLNFPCVRIQRDYRDVQDIIRMCRRRIRVPEFWYGDYLASLGATRIGEQRLKEFVDKYGKETIRAFIREWLDYSERRTVHAIRQLPSGRLVGAGCHDPLPGFPDGIPVQVIVDVDAEQGRIQVDLRDNMDCVAAGVNLSETCAVSGALIGVMNCIDPTIPRNQGCFRRINVLLRDNCVVGRPKFPASCSMATTNVLNRLINATQCAFSQLGEGYGMAEGAGSMGVGFGAISGTDRRYGDAPYVNMIIAGSNGGPGAPTCDGWITYTMPDCATSVLVDSMEIIEQKYPVLFRSVKFLSDTGGPGRFRGAPAGEAVYGPRHDPMTVGYWCEYNDKPPQGTRGGLPGSRSFARKVSADGKEEELPSIGMVELHPGEYIHGAESGGGGYGRPIDRDPDRVLHDVMERWVTKEQALDVYGVVLTGAAADETLSVDGQATARRRAELAEQSPE